LTSLRPLGLAAGKGAWTATDYPHPVDDLTADIANPWVSEKGRRAQQAGALAETQTVERWPWVLLHIDRPQTRAHVYITRRGAANWDMLISVLTQSHTVLGIAAEEFISEWANLLERVGNVLYAGACPALTVLTATSDSEYESSPATVERRQLAVGWRTWYGPSYVSEFGRELLLGLPDRTQSLTDGGVAHAIDVPLTAMVHGDPEAYKRVWAYLDAAEVEPAWPSRRKQRNRKRLVRDEDAASIRLRSDIRGLLTTTVELGGSKRLKMLPLHWAALSGLERSVAVDTVREMLQKELDDHLDAAVHLETSELPKELRQVLEDLAANAGDRLTFAVVPQLSPVGDLSENNT